MALGWVLNILSTSVLAATQMRLPGRIVAAGGLAPRGFHCKRCKVSSTAASKGDRMQRPFPTHQQGFTLIEVIVVLLLIGTLTAVVMSRGGGVGDAEFSAQQEVLKSHIRYAQTRAMNTNRVWGISLSSGSYAVFVQDGGKQNMVVPGQPGAIISLPSGMTVSSGEVSFDQWGRPYNNDTATGSSSTIGVTVTYNGASRSFSIFKNTGFIP